MLFRTNLLLVFAVLSTGLMAQEVVFQEIGAEVGVNAIGINLGVSVGDFDNDGDDDLYFSRITWSNILYENLGNGFFNDITDQAGLTTIKGGRSSVWGDIDNDGDLDLYVGIAREGNHLFLNNGNGTFEDITQSAGLQLNAETIHCLMADVDNDGFLDIYVTINNDENKLYKNNGDGTFTDVTVESGALDDTRAMGAGFFDYDKDGDLDLYLVHDFGFVNNLYQNDGTGHFVDVARQAGVNFSGDGMGVAFGDYNNDRWLDMYITNLNENLLYLNNADGTFTDVTEQAGVADGGMSWGCSFLDYDNDGWLDIFVANETKFIELPDHWPNVLFRNNDNGTFEDVSIETGISTYFNSFGNAILDYDGNGWLDIAVANNTGSTGNEFFVNMGGNNNWFVLELEGTVSNRDAVGTRVEAFAGDWQRVDEVRAGSGYNSQSSLALEFGLGQMSQIDSLLIYWASGIQETFFDIPANRHVKIVEDVGIVTDVRVAMEEGLPPNTIALFQNYPNPFNPSTTISYQLTGESRVKLSISNILGQRIRDLIDEIQPAGMHRVMWMGTDRLGHKVSSGIYVAQLEAESKKISRKMLLLK